MSDSLWHHGLQHARPPCPSPTPRVYWNSCPLSQWCNQPSHSLLSPSPPAFNLSQHQGLFKWVSSSHQVAKVLEFQLPVLAMNIQDWIPLGWTGWIALQSKGLSRVFSNTTYHILFVHLCVDGHLGCFDALAIINSASTNIEVHVCF